MTVRSLGLALVLAVTAFACSDPGTPPATDESTGAASKDDSVTAPASDAPASTKPETTTPATDTPAPATKTPVKDTAADKATTPAKDKPANDQGAGAGAGDAAAKLTALKACVEGCAQDTECVKTCLTDLAGGGGLPQLPGLPGGG